MFNFKRYFFYISDFIFTVLTFIAVFKVRYSAIFFPDVGTRELGYINILMFCGYACTIFIQYGDETLWTEQPVTRQRFRRKCLSFRNCMCVYLDIYILYFKTRFCQIRIFLRTVAASDYTNNYSQNYFQNHGA